MECFKPHVLTLPLRINPTISGSRCWCQGFKHLNEDLDQERHSHPKYIQSLLTLQIPKNEDDEARIIITSLIRLFPVLRREP